MTIPELEQAIRDMFPKIYNKCYDGTLIVKEIIDNDNDVIGYKLSLGLNAPEKPLQIACDGNAEQFLKYVASELQYRHLEFTEYYTAIQLYEYGT